MKSKLILAAVVACSCLEWTRLSGTVKSVNLKASTVTLETREGDLFTVPIDKWQDQIKRKNDELVGIQLKDLKLDEKITITRTETDPPKDDTEGLAPPETPARGE
jgi:hypothetical protein